MIWRQVHHGFLAQARWECEYNGHILCLIHWETGERAAYIDGTNFRWGLEEQRFDVEVINAHPHLLISKDEWDRFIAYPDELYMESLL